MNALSSLFGIATETIFTLTAGLVARFCQFPLQPYKSVVMTSRLLRTHHLSTVALLAFSFLIFALLPVGTGVSGFGESLQKLWEIDKREAEALYLFLFVLGATVLTIMTSGIFNDSLVINKPAKGTLPRASSSRYRRIFVDIYNVFVAFTVLWFVVLSVISAHLFQVFGAAKRLQTLEVKIAAGDLLKKIGFADVSDLVVSPAFYLIWAVSLYFGYRMLATWRPRREFRKLVSGESAQLLFGIAERLSIETCRA